MKRMKIEARERLRETLSAAYYEKEKVEVGKSWQRRVMGEIRAMGAVSAKANDLELFEWFVWRFAPAAVILIVVLIAAITQFDFVSQYEIAELLMEDPADFSFSALLGT